MAGSKGSIPDVIRPTRSQGGGLKAGYGKSGASTGQNRRVLGEINQNIITASTAYAVGLPGIIDVDDDFGAPMFVQHTESMLEEIDKMDEDIYEEPLLDIDDADKGDPLAVVEYIDDIYAHYRKEEISSCVSPSYMSRQHDITDRMRGILIDWLIEVHYKFELMEETLYLTVNLVDRYLEREGNDEYPPIQPLGSNSICVYQELELLSFYLIDLRLVEYEMLKFPPSLLAAAAVFTAESTLNRSKQWTKTSEFHSQYSQNQLLECSKMMVGLHQKAGGTGKLVAVFKKYSTSKFGHVARTQPAIFILEPRFWD
ncbi:hypothetical protein L1987_39748 [Smallanthus sonchifolius]|uniref:Uncharacterized protein n=1 Tax=Smallanthus sonchifolius TaxID=185202 RepID=A0ACB9HP15_9ASTR|nr:hypothetical protein L1987_39748 [Smallanthus sonchifolius]